MSKYRIQKTWICYHSELREWKIVNAGTAEEAAEAAELEINEPDDGSNSWESTWVVGLAPDDFDEGRPVFPSPDDFDGKEVTIEVEKETIYHYRVAK